MTTPVRPGWYPAPDGSGTEQWWNGASWSDAKRGPAGAALPGVPGYQAAPPPSPAAAPGIERPDPYTAPPPPAPYPTLQQVAGQNPSVAGRTVTLSNSTPVIAFIFGMLSIFVFGLLGIVGIALGVVALRKPETVGRVRGLAFGGIITGIVGLVIGAVQVIFFIVALTGLPSS